MIISKTDKIAQIIIYIILYVALSAVRWIATCGLVKLISLCFGFQFTWKIGTGVWLVALVMSWNLPNVLNFEKKER